MAESADKLLPYLHITSLSVQELRSAAGDAVTFRLCMGSDVTLDVDSESISIPLHHPLPPSFTLQVLHKSSARPVGAATIHTSDVAGDLPRLLMYSLRGGRGEDVGVIVSLTAKLIGADVVPSEKFTSLPAPAYDPASPQTTMILHAVPYLEISQIYAEDLNIGAAHDEAYVVVRTGPGTAGADTVVVKNGGSCPWWEETLHIPIPAARLGWYLTVELWCKRRSCWFVRDELAGAAQVPMPDIVEGYIPAEQVQFLSYVMVGKKKEKVGIINFAVKMVVTGDGEEEDGEGK